MEIKFKSRNPINNIAKISKKDALQLDKIIEILNELADLGWNSNQWSTSTPDFEIEDVEKIYPTYKSMSEDEKFKVMGDYIDTLPEYFFIESFGNKKYGYLRADRPTVLECAQSCLEQAKIMINCINHDWIYSHSNCCHKTCKICGTFTKCSLEEALEHFPKGAFELNESLTLYFNHNKELCTCGSHKLYYNTHSMFNKTNYQCTECHEFKPTKYKKTKPTSFNYLSVSPLDNDYDDAIILTDDDSPHNRHELFTIGYSNKEFVNQLIQRYTLRMLLHFLHVEQRSCSEFFEWFKPYIKKCIAISNLQIKENEQYLDITDIIPQNIEIDLIDNHFEFKLTYDLVLMDSNEKKDSPEIIFNNLFTSLVKVTSK